MTLSRPARLAAIALAVIAFLAVSAGLARFLTTENAERDAILGVLQAQVRGDAAGVLAHLHGCASDPACTATARADAATLRRPGTVKILRLDSHTAYSLGSASGRTRVAWNVPGRLPVVQCVLVRRSGNAVSGQSISLLALSAPISNTGVC